MEGGLEQEQLQQEAELNQRANEEEVRSGLFWHCIVFLQQRKKKMCSVNHMKEPSYISTVTSAH